MGQLFFANGTELGGHETPTPDNNKSYYSDILNKRGALNKRVPALLGVRNKRRTSLHAGRGSVISDGPRFMLDEIFSQKNCRPKIVRPKNFRPKLFSAEKTNRPNKKIGRKFCGRKNFRLIFRSVKRDLSCSNKKDLFCSNKRDPSCSNK